MFRVLILKGGNGNTRKIAKQLRIMAEDVKMDVLDLESSTKVVDPKQYDVIIASDGEYDFDELKFGVMCIVSSMEKVVVFNSNSDVIYINKDLVLGAEIFGKTCTVYTTTQVYTIMNHSLTEILEKMNSPYLLRCHKSYAVNVRYLKALEHNTRHTWTAAFNVETDFRCIVGSKYYEKIVRLIK